MKIKATVTGPADRLIEHVADVREQGDLAQAIGEALDIYRRLYPDAPPFEKTIKIDHA